MLDLEHAQEVSSLKDITALRLRTGDNNGNMFIKTDDLIILVAIVYAGAYAYTATCYKDGKKIDYFEDSSIVTVKRYLKDTYTF